MKPHYKLHLDGHLSLLRPASKKQPGQKEKTFESMSLREARAQFTRRGKSVAQWAREHHVNQSLTYQVLRGDKKGLRGEAHRIAVLLGIKDGIA